MAAAAGEAEAAGHAGHDTPHVRALHQQVQVEAARRNPEVLRVVFLALATADCEYQKTLAELKKHARHRNDLVTMCDHWSADGQDQYEYLTLKVEHFELCLRLMTPCKTCRSCLAS